MVAHRILAALRAWREKGQPVRLDIVRNGQPASSEVVASCLTLIVEASCCDGSVGDEEVDDLLDFLQREFGREGDEAVALVKEVVNVRDVKGAITVVLREYSALQREHLLACLQSIVDADGRQEKSERRFIEQMRNRLQVGGSG